MKKLYTSLLSAVILFLLCDSIAYSQVSASATASANVVLPITITKTADLNFGNVAVSTAPGSVVLSVSGTRTATGGVTLPTTVGTPAPATFTVTGEPAYTYHITLPAAPVVIANGGNTMTVSSFISSPSPTGSLTSGVQTVTVASTLHVNGAQPAGTYVSPSPFTVTVNYN